MGSMEWATPGKFISSCREPAPLGGRIDCDICRLRSNRLAAIAALLVR